MMLTQSTVLPPPAPPPPDLNYNAHISHHSAVQVRPKQQIPNKPTFHLRTATLQDAPVIAQLGASVFATTFGFSIPTRDLDAYLDEAYSVSAIEADISSTTKHVVVACAGLEGHVVGFAQLTEGTTEPCIQDLDDVVELQRLYVHPDYLGIGMGRALTRQTETMAKQMGYRILWLGVWEGNFQAQRIYEAMGFSRAGDHEFQMGRCIQTDWIMCKNL